MLKFSVWVGGTEVNDYYLDTEAEAKKLCEQYEALGYDDVAIETLTIED